MPTRGRFRAGGLAALDARAARGNLLAWAQTGITLVRDVGLGAA